MQIFTNANYNFLRWRWHAIILSLIVIAAGAFMIATRGLPLGIDFSGGVAFVVQGAPEADIRRALDSIPGEKVIQQYDDPSKGQILVRLPRAEDGSTLETGSSEASSKTRISGCRCAMCRSDSTQR